MIILILIVTLSGLHFKSVDFFWYNVKVLNSFIDR